MTTTVVKKAEHITTQRRPGDRMMGFVLDKELYKLSGSTGYIRGVDDLVVYTIFPELIKNK